MEYHFDNRILALNFGVKITLHERDNKSIYPCPSDYPVGKIYFWAHSSSQQWIMGIKVVLYW